MQKDIYIARRRKWKSLMSLEENFNAMKEAANDDGFEARKYLRTHWERMKGDLESAVADLRQMEREDEMLAESKWGFMSRLHDIDKALEGKAKDILPLTEHDESVVARANL